jgi:hypothetical protein
MFRADARALGGQGGGQNPVALIGPYLDHSKPPIKREPGEVDTTAIMEV